MIKNSEARAVNALGGGGAGVQTKLNYRIQVYFSFNEDIHSRTTRQKNLLRLPRVRLEVAKKAIYFHGCAVYNDVSIFIINY